MNPNLIAFSDVARMPDIRKPLRGTRNMKTIAMMAVAAFSAAVCHTKPEHTAVSQAVRNARQRLPASVATAHFKVWQLERNIA
jgi:hypothetical protein